MIAADGWIDKMRRRKRKQLARCVHQSPPVSRTGGLISRPVGIHILTVRMICDAERVQIVVFNGGPALVRAEPISDGLCRPDNGRPVRLLLLHNPLPLCESEPSSCALALFAAQFGGPLEAGSATPGQLAPI